MLQRLLFPILALLTWGLATPAAAQSRGSGGPATSTSGHRIIALQGRILHPPSRTLVLTDDYGNEVLRTQTGADGRFQFRACWGTAQPATLQLGTEVARLWLSPATT